LALLLGLTAGMHVTKTAQIEVQDVLFPFGALRDEISWRAAITKGCGQRCVYLTLAKAVEALDRYLCYRVSRGLRTTGEPGRYRGLESNSSMTSDVGLKNCPRTRNMRCWQLSYLNGWHGLNKSMPCAIQRITQIRRSEVG